MGLFFIFVREAVFLGTAAVLLGTAAMFLGAATWGMEVLPGFAGGRAAFPAWQK